MKYKTSNKSRIKKKRWREIQKLENSKKNIYKKKKIGQHSKKKEKKKKMKKVIIIGQQTTNNNWKYWVKPNNT